MSPESKLPRNIKKKLKSMAILVGNTPLLSIRFKYKGDERVIYAKAEHMNMTGSIKDRMALHIIHRAYLNGELKRDMVIAEATSGNTGISFAALGRALGHKVKIFMPDWMSQERKDLIRSFGADIHLVSAEQGGFLGSIKMAEELAAKDPNVFLPKQFANMDNITAHFETTGPEMWWQLRFRSLIPSAFIAGVGTGGTVMGVGRFLKKMNPDVKIHPLEPSNSPTLSRGCKVGSHRIQGISDEFIPPIVDINTLDEIVSVDDGDAIMMAQKLAGVLGIGVGISSGANFLGALKIQESMGKESVVVTVFPDDNKKYLSTALFQEEEIKPDSLTPHVELLDFYAQKRVCHTCCDPVECVEENSLTQPSDLDLLLPCCPRRRN
jgi:cysteine synthase A